MVRLCRLATVTEDNPLLSRLKGFHKYFYSLHVDKGKKYILFELKSIS